MNAADLRTLADLIDQGHPADYIGVGESVTVVTNPVSAARWMERCPNGVLPGTSTPVAVQVIPVLAVEGVWG